MKEKNDPIKNLNELLKDIAMTVIYESEMKKEFPHLFYPYGMGGKCSNTDCGSR